MNLQHFNQPQQDAILCIDRPCLVLAGAGSGKTRVITQKIAHLIHQAGYESKRIRAVTFTNKAAREMKLRASSLLGKNESRGLKITTFHTLGLNILQQDYFQLGYRKGFSIFDGKDVEATLTELQHKTDPEAELIKQTQYQISRWKNDFLNPDLAMAQADTPVLQHHAKIYAVYQQQLLACNAMDFDDLIMLPVVLFRANQEVLNKWQDRIHYLLVDEYQDTNHSQYEMIRLLCQHRQRLTVVGDDDQSIYAWRGANPQNIHQLQHDFGDLQIIKLEQNYRSSSRILRAANQLISNNPHLIDKKLWSAAGEGEFIRVLPCKNTENEAEQVTIDLIGRHFQTGDSYRNFAILYRGNHQSRVYEKVLRDHSIPYQITGGTAFFERVEIKDLTAYLRIICNPDDDQALLRIINTPRRNIGASTLKKLGEYAASRHASLSSVLNDIGLQQQLSHKGKISLQRFAGWLDEMRFEAEQMSPMEFTRKLIKQLDYQDWISDTSNSPKQAESRMENVEELVSWIGNLQKNITDPTLGKLSSQLTLMSILQNNDEKNDSESVQLMTLHAAKGLEFAHVYIVGFEEDSLPHHQCQDDENLQEERRLAYVGITRAEKTLTLSYAKIRQRYGETSQCEASRFLTELPAEDLEGAEFSNANLSQDEKKQKGMDHLADLKSLLSNT